MDASSDSSKSLGVHIPCDLPNQVVFARLLNTRAAYDAVGEGAICVFETEKALLAPGCGVDDEYFGGPSAT